MTGFGRPTPSSWRTSVLVEQAQRPADPHQDDRLLTLCVGRIQLEAAREELARARSFFAAGAGLVALSTITNLVTQHEQTQAGIERCQSCGAWCHDRACTTPGCQ